MFDFLTAQARAHDNLALHCGYGPVRFAIQCDDDVTYAVVDAAGVQLGGTPPGGGADFTMAATQAH